MIVDLKLKSKCGRPRKKQKLLRNPFEFRKGRNKGRNVKCTKGKGTLVVHKNSVDVEEKEKDSNEKNAEKIVESAEYMGLEIVWDKAVVIQNIAEQLKTGKL